MKQLVFENAQSAFEFLYDYIMKNGHDDVTNGTKCLYNVGFLIENPKDNKINTPWRKWNQSYADFEYQWYMEGNPSADVIETKAKIWSKMYDPNDPKKRVNSNYGYQWSRNGQIDETIKQLKENNGTRQAWISIFDGKEKSLYKYDTPCTLAVGYRIRTEGEHKYLDCDVLMRSNDLVYGFCNDQYCWSMLMYEICERLGEGYEIGRIHWYASDLHIYERHWNMKK